MGSIYLRKYGVATTVNFCLYELDGTDLKVDAVAVAGDIKIMKDEDPENNTTNTFADEGTGYSLALTNTEMEAARIAIYIVDQTAPKVWLDKVLLIETYGDASAQHPFDLATATQNVNVASMDNIDFGAVMKASINTEVDGALNTAIPGAPAADSINDVVKDLDGKLPTNNIMGSSVKTDKDDEIDAIKGKTDNLPVDPADESLLEAEINANETKIDALQVDVTAIKGYVDTEIAAIKAVTDTLSLAAIADAVHDEVTEGTTTLRQAIKIMSSALFGKSSGGGTATLVFQDVGDTKPRITATCDADGNRTAVTVDGT